MPRDLEATWKGRLRLMHRKEGRTLITAVVHCTGLDEPPLEALLLAVADWRGTPLGQAVRRPNEGESQVYWVNLLKQP